MRIQKEKKTTPLSVVKRMIIVLSAIFFLVLLFLLMLPKEPDIVKGVTYDLTYPKISHYSQIPREVFEKDFQLMKKAGVNAIRLYASPPPFILDLAEKYGIDVIETVVFPGDWTDFTSPYQLQALKREAIRNIERDKDRECILAWSIWNDAPWTYGSGKGDVIRAYGERTVSSFLKSLYETVKKHDPLRPVTGANLTVNDEAKRLGADFLDILGYNVYLGISDWKDGSYDGELSKKMVDELVVLSKKYDKPVIIMETGYSTYWKKHSQQEVIRDQIAKVDRRIRGLFLFQWSDDWAKAGSVKTHDNHVEEHWGLLEGERELKGGYTAASQMFRNSLLRRFLLAVSDYFRGGYFAAEKRALRRRWKEEPIVDKEIEDLQNRLSLKPSSRDVPVTLEILAKKFFDKKGFDQFAQFLKEYKAAYTDSEYISLLDYYIALSGWQKLEYIASQKQWELYYAEKTRTLDAIIKRLESAEEHAVGKESFLDILHLQWLIHNTMITGRERVALEKMEEGIRSYSKSSGNIAVLLAYSRLLSEGGERQVSKNLLKEYASYASKFMEPEEAVLLLHENAGTELQNKNFERAKILYDAYVNVVVRHYGDEEAAFKLLELANLYKVAGYFDESIEIYRQLLKDFPNSELADDATFAIAVSLKESKTYSKAIKAFTEFIKNYSDSELAKSAIREVLSIFTIYGSGTREKKTVAFLTEMVALFPDSEFSIMARFELASSLASLGKREEALREYQYIIDNYPDSDYATYSRQSIERLGATE